MSVRSHTKIWLHIIWSTYNKEKLLLDRNFRKEISEYIFNYSTEKKIFMKTIYINAEHAHALIDLPTDKTIEDVMHLLKGNSSYWINQKVNFKFAWGKGYAAFSVSESSIERVTAYIRNQEEHHRKISFTEEYELFLKKYKLTDTGLL